METSGDGPRWALVGEPLFREVGDEVFVLTRDSQMHWLKNTTARFLWERLVAGGTGGCSTVELAEALAGEFEVEEAVAQVDVVRFCEHLAHHGLVRAKASTVEATVVGAHDAVQAPPNAARAGPGRG